MKNLKKIAQFILGTIAGEICFLASCIFVFRIDLIVELLNSKPSIALVCLTIGATIGFLVGVLATYYKLITELNNKNSEVKKLKKDLSKAEKILEQVLPDVITIRKMQAAKSAEEAQTQSAKRAKQVLAEIKGLSDEDDTAKNLEEVINE